MAIKLLVEGQHFGEIGMMFKCSRTATVTSRNYNTMARLGLGEFKEVSIDYPEFYDILIKSVYSYNDTWKKFMFRILN